VRRSAGLGRRASVAAVALVVLAGTALGSSVAAATGGVPPAPAPAVLLPINVVAATGPAPTPAGVVAAVSPLIGPSLGAASIIVIDPTGGVVLFDKKGSVPRTPASTLKLATSATVLNVLGPQTRIPTIVYGKGRTLYLVGGGDPTLVRSKGGDPLAGGSASMKALARATALTLTAGSPVKVVYDDSAFSGPTLGPGWPTGFPSAGVVAPVTALVVDGGRVRPGAFTRVSDPSRQAAEAFAGFLRGQGLTVKSVKSGTRDTAAKEITRVESPPVGDIVQRMLTDSENNYAEALAHLAGGSLVGDPSFAGGVLATTRTLTAMGIDTSAVSIVDASGLSTRDRLPALVLAAVLSDTARASDPDLAAIPPGLAVAGFTGTLADRYTTPQTAAGRGVVHAKTGTLTGVVSLAGTVQDREGRVLVFAIISNKVTSLARARETMDRIASQLAGCGCR
jgi:D-alanyl-D-alanine carboxypeptidase/D-alanyl-D-alanine-endopeptidase (penicillin-binding protein 4)